MKDTLLSSQELYHEIFGSILDRTEMTPYLLLRSDGYITALKQATKMLGNRGFDTQGCDEFRESEKERARQYLEQVYKYFVDWMFPFCREQVKMLASLKSANVNLYMDCLQSINDLERVLTDRAFRQIVTEDPRHLFLLASSKKYPRVFYGYQDRNLEVPPEWQQLACSILKMGHLVKSIEEDSQDINDYAQLGVFLEGQGQSLQDLYNYDWGNPEQLPENEAAQRAFVKISDFFHKLKESLMFDAKKGCLVFKSMFTKLGKSVEEEAYDIRDILAITFILKSRDDTLKLFHALQKRGVILQENTVSHSITQTLFEDPADMIEATRILMSSLSQSEGKNEMPGNGELLDNATGFFDALSVNASKNLHSSAGHKKFQCKITFSLPIHRTSESNEIMVPGTSVYSKRDSIGKKTEQHTLSVELRISDEQSWHDSEQKGDSHHDAYKFRQLVSVMNRVFRNKLLLPPESFGQLRRDQIDLFP
jgi:uncharacterized protein (TIGR04562 family)